MTLYFRITLISLLILSIIIAMLVYHVVQTPYYPKDKILIGKVEEVGVEAMDTVIESRIDTGAGMTSLNAEILEIMEAKDGGPDRVKFKVTDDLGAVRVLEKDVIKWQRIKNKGSDGYTNRPVVKMDLCLGGKEIFGRVNLVDRSSFKYQLLIGRNFLETGGFVVDPDAEKISHQSKCS